MFLRARGLTVTEQHIARIRGAQPDLVVAWLERAAAVGAVDELFGS